MKQRHSQQLKCSDGILEVMTKQRRRNTLMVPGYGRYDYQCIINKDGAENVARQVAQM